VHVLQVSTIEFSMVEMSVLHGLKQGNDVLKEIHREMNVEAVEKLMEETAEAREYQRVRVFRSSTTGSLIQELTQEVGDMLANTLTLDDEEAVQAELEALVAEQVRCSFPFGVLNNNDMSRQLPSVPLPIHAPEEDVKLPSVPTHLLVEETGA
jgi:charged multivesicular body protein 6